MKRLGVLAVSVALAASLSACSDDKPDKPDTAPAVELTARPAPDNPNPVSTIMSMTAKDLALPADANIRELLAPAYDGLLNSTATATNDGRTTFAIEFERLLTAEEQAAVTDLLAEQGKVSEQAITATETAFFNGRASVFFPGEVPEDRVERITAAFATDPILRDIKDPFVGFDGYKNSYAMVSFRFPAELDVAAVEKAVEAAVSTALDVPGVDFGLAE